MNRDIPLDGIWRFAPDPFDEGEHLGWHSPAHDASGWREVAVPTVFDRCGPGMAGYKGAGWFRRKVQVPEGWLDGGGDVRFDGDGANCRVTLWVNGEEVTEAGSAVGFLSFGASVRSRLISGKENVLVLRVDNSRPEGTSLPKGDRQAFGGILRPLRLTRIPQLSLAPLPFVAAGLLPRGAGSLHLRVEPRHRMLDVETPSGEVWVQLRLTDPAGEPVVTDVSDPITFDDAGNATVEFAWVVAGVSVWSPDSPDLYTAELSLLEDEAVRDVARVRFGFRSVSVREGRVCLNGDPILLYGFTLYEDSPRTDAVSDPETARQDLLRMKEMGANFVRLAQHPHDERTLDLCDEIGLLVMADVLHPSAVSDAAADDFARLIRRDRHHPCVMAWSVSNAAEEQQSETEGNATLVRRLKDLDPTRLTTHVSNRWTDNPDFDADDLISVSGFPTWEAHGLAEPRQPHYAPSEGGNWWTTHLARLRERYPEKAVLVAGFGYPALEGVHDGNISEETQTKVLAEELSGILRCPSVSGAAVDCWADHSTQGENRINSLAISPFGVVTRERKSKAARQVLEAAFQGRTHRPSLVLRRPNLEGLPEVESLLPEGYAVRTRQDDDLPGLTALMARAYPELTWDGERVHAALVADTTVKTTFVITHGPDIVATASARWQPDRYPDEGYVHWVASDPTHRGKSLGLIATLATLHEFRRWGAKGSVLHTDDFRVPAIKVYLKLGFRPVLSHATHAPRWAKLRLQLAPADLTPLQGANGTGRL